MSSQTTDTREKILEATIRMLAEHGGQGVRMADIARAAGVSRQAVYLHFASRTELLVAAARYLDQKLNIDDRLAPSRAATSGVERLSLYIDCWGNYIPEIYAVAKALMLDQNTDEAAAVAWRDRMEAMRDGCAAAINALYSDGVLASGWSRPKATEALWTLLLVPNWENLTQQCGWSTKEYVRRTTLLARSAFVEAGQPRTAGQVS